MLQKGKGPELKLASAAAAAFLRLRRGPAWSSSSTLGWIWHRFKEKTRNVCFIARYSIPPLVPLSLGFECPPHHCGPRQSAPVRQALCHHRTCPDHQVEPGISQRESMKAESPLQWVGAHLWCQLVALILLALLWLLEGKIMKTSCQRQK